MPQIVFDLNTDGHRQSYFQIFEKLFGSQRIIGRDQIWKCLGAKSAVFISVDDYFLLYFAVAFIRNLFGKKTTGILIRAENLVNLSITPKRILKKSLLKFMKSQSHTQNLGIVPFQILPGLKPYLHNTIFDLQFWDLPVLLPDPSPSMQAHEFFDKIKARAGGRKVVMAVGRQDAVKGTLFFFDLWRLSEIREHFLFVIVGKNRSLPEERYKEFNEKGGLAWDQEVSETDLVLSYQQADLIWCCYRPDYDVSSGIFGRSVQMKKTALTRRGSLISKYGGQQIELPYDQPRMASQILLRRESNPKPELTTNYRLPFDQAFGHGSNT